MRKIKVELYGTNRHQAQGLVKNNPYGGLATIVAFLSIGLEKTLRDLLMTDVARDIGGAP